jgi:hypothetical protein
LQARGRHRDSAGLCSNRALGCCRKSGAGQQNAEGEGSGHRGRGAHELISFLMMIILNPD